MSYYDIKIIRFYIKCTRCSAQLTFRTDPKHNDYEAEEGIRRNFEPWREAKLAEETEEERLDRLEAEERDRDPMAELEAKAHDAAKEMEVADALDEMRMRNTRMERRDREGVTVGDGAAAKTEAELERERQDAEDAEAARRAFLSGTGEGRVKRLLEDGDDDGDESFADDGVGLSASVRPTEALRDTPDVGVEGSKTSMFAPRPKRRKADHAAALGIKKKVVEESAAIPKPVEPAALVVGDDDDW